MHTHQVTIADGRLTKTFSSWDRGEHHREWTALTMLSSAAPDLAPTPLAADLEAQPPWVTMSVLPGEPPSGVWSDPQVRALESALDRLWSVAPGDLPPLHDVHSPEFWRTLLEEERRPASGLSAEAFDHARAFLSGPAPEAIHDHSARAVLGQGDPNRDNFLWDGSMITIVDFEDASASDLGFELANQIEHLANRHAGFAPLLERFEVDPDRLLLCRRLLSCFWLRLLLPGNLAHRRNPPGTLESQAERCLGLLA